MVSANGSRVADESVPDRRERRRREHRLDRQGKNSKQERLINQFQPDAVELERRAVSPAAGMTLYTIIALLVAAVAWASWAEVDRIVTAQGQLVSLDPPIVIDSKLSTPIASLNARFGDRVEAGTVIATMDPTFSDADVKQLEERKASLNSVIARLTAEREGISFDLAGHQDNRGWIMQSQLFGDRQRSFEAEMRKFDAQVSALQVQLENTKRETLGHLDSYKEYSEYLKEIRRLREKRSASRLQLLQWEQQVKDARQSALSSESRGKEIEESIDAIEAERRAFRAAARAEVVTELVRAVDELKGLEQEEKKAMRQNQFAELRVPDDLPYDEFVVLEMTEKSVGSVLQPGEPLYRLIPVGVDMELEVDIQGKDIGRVQEASANQIAAGDLPGGSEARVKLSSFPYQKHGALEGAIRTISEGSFEQQSASGVGNGVTMYRARIALKKPYDLQEVTENFRLMPGMTATAEIKVGTRRVIDYFLYPLLRGSEALREP